MANEQKGQQTQAEKKERNFPPYLGIFEEEKNKESLYYKKVVASSKENVKCKPYIDNYSATSDHKYQPSPYYCTLTGIKFDTNTSPYAMCIQCAKRNTFKETPYCKSIEEAEARFKYN